MQSGIPYLEIENISKTFINGKKSCCAIKDLSFRVKKGEFLTILGPSGCGKTSFLRILAGLDNEYRGEIFFKGKSLNKIPSYKRPLSMVFQNYALFPHLTVFDNLAYSLKLQKLSKELIYNEVSSICQMCNLIGLESRLPSQLSGGQQQRVALGRSLILKPEILLFDEPLSNLDIKLRQETRREIKWLQKQLNITIIYVTHDQSEAMSLSDQILVMHQGKVEQLGTPLAIYSSPKTPFIADFIGGANFIEVEIIKKNQKTLALLLADQIIKLPQKNELWTLGEKGLLTVPPEAVTLSSHSGLFKGKIILVDFQGATTEYTIGWEGLHIRALVSNMEQTKTLYQYNDDIYFSINLSLVKLFKRSHP